MKTPITNILEALTGLTLPPFRHRLAPSRENLLLGEGAASKRRANEFPHPKSMMGDLSHLVRHA